MGGDGGTISSNRTYLRGAGKACHTADHPSNAAKRAKIEDTERAKLLLTTCAISGAVFDLTPNSKQSNNSSINGNLNSCSGEDIVVCPYGKLYKREEALEALLRRSQQINNNGSGGTTDVASGALGSHVRGMKDLHPVRFYVTASASSNGGSSNSNNNNGNGKGRYSATCPITSADIGSGNVPSFVIVRSKNPKKSKDKKKDISSSTTHTDETSEIDELGPNVISERAIKEMGIEGLQSEYGPFEERNMIRLAPPKAGGVFEEIQRMWEVRMEEERVAKLQKKKKKRKRDTTEDVVSVKQTMQTKTSLPTAAAPAAAASIPGKKSSLADEARNNVQTKVAQNSVLSSLFGGAGGKNLSEKEKKDALFTRNC